MIVEEIVGVEIVLKKNLLVRRCERLTAEDVKGSRGSTQKKLGRKGLDRT